MTNDKTVTMSRELVLIDQELLVIANVCVMRIHDLLVEQLKATDHKDEYRAEISRLKNTHTQLIAALAAPVVERQEPVLFVAVESIEDLECVGMHATRKANDLQHVALYTSPPAPVAVVLPERKVGHPCASQHRAYNEGFNSAIDKVKEMNQ